MPPPARLGTTTRLNNVMLDLSYNNSNNMDPTSKIMHSSCKHSSTMLPHSPAGTVLSPGSLTPFPAAHSFAASSDSLTIGTTATLPESYHDVAVSRALVGSLLEGFSLLTKLASAP